ncbi:hypothetical protein [Pontibacter burrus]|uniref:Late embryogenesis abundant protein LEA-2 subgroup domain-containing protein n=1 Tax=Pontibacter burrus TaxID=2704466 RepID=A0A6B3M0R5_9BACT|nr:hypothetical protein [Pontibacter burrus]NEM99227.1 hypothetical protein [Pontibacter burrus]
MMRTNRLFILKMAVWLLLPLFIVSCSTKSDVDAFKAADYDLAGIDELQLNGINLLNKTDISDFSFSDATRLYSAITQNKLAATSTLGLRVSLPEGSKDRTMTVQQLKWQLLVDGKQAVSGLVSEPVELKDGLNTITLSSPVKLSETNGQVDMNQLLGFAMLLNQKGTNKPDVSLQIKPTIQTSIGPFELPAFITVTK